LTEAAAAGSIGLINSVGNLGGFVGPYMMGWFEKSTGSFVVGLALLSVALVSAAAIVFFVGLGRVREPA
jgi:ACS family tartrate transporter-like MFS transporter